MNCKVSFLLSATLAFGSVSAAAYAAIGEVSAYVGYASGSYGTGTESEVTTSRISFNAGDTYQLRVDAGWLWVDSPIGVLPNRTGPVPVGRRHGADNPGSGGMGAGQLGNGMDGGVGGGNQPLTEPGDGSEPLEPEPVSASGFGDVFVAASRRIVGGGAHVFRMDGGAEVKAPTADPDEGLGTGEWDARIGLSSEYRFWSATAFAGAGWNYFGDPEWVELADVIDAYGGIESEPLAGRWIVSGWLAGNPEVVEGVGNRMILGAGLRSTGSWRFNLQATAGLTDGSEDFTFVLGVSHGVLTPTVGTRGPRR